MPQPDVFQRSGNLLNRATQTYQDVSNPNALLTSMNKFINPYTKQVMNNTLRTMNEQKAIDLNTVKGQAAQSGAFGGSRHGLVESQIYDTYNQNQGDLVSTMLQDRFNTSATLGQQSLNNQMQGAQGLLGISDNLHGRGIQSLDRTAQDGQQQQQLLQAILSTGNGQFDAYAGHPQQQLSSLLASISGSPLGGNQTSSYKPGLFDYLGLGAQMGSAALGGK